MVTHDQEEALTMADRIVVMNHGVIEQVGTPTQIYREPGTLFVADFIGAMNQVAGLTIDASSVSIGDIKLDSHQHEIQSGSAVTVAIRPEDIIPHGEGARSPGAPDSISNENNTLDVHIEDMEFLGSFWRVSLTNAALGEKRLLADMSINAIRRMNIEIGSDISVELPAKNLWVFPDRAG